MALAREDRAVGVAGGGAGFAGRGGALLRAWRGGGAGVATTTGATPGAGVDHGALRALPMVLRRGRSARLPSSGGRATPHARTAELA